MRDLVRQIEIQGYGVTDAFWPKVHAVPVEVDFDRTLNHEDRAFLASIEKRDPTLPVFDVSDSRE